MASSVAPKKSTNLNIVKVLILTKYGRLGASSRLRFLQYLPSLKAVNIETTIQPLISDEVLRQRYNKGSYDFFLLLKCYFNRCLAMIKRNRFDVLWIEKEALPWAPFWFESLLLRGVPYVLDYDDAVFHTYDLHRIRVLRWVYGTRLDYLMAGSALVVAGNQYLAQRALEASSRKIEVIPTVVDLFRYAMKDYNFNAKRTAGGQFRIVWVGSPSTIHYLELLRGPLQKLAETYSFVLRVIGGGTIKINSVEIESLPWSEDTEARYIGECDVGVMPLLSSPWEAGKCGYKLIQYMACGLPVVASKVGANLSIVKQGYNGFLVDTDDEWMSALSSLMEDEGKRIMMGQAGRESVSQRFCIEKTGPKMASLLIEVARPSAGFASNSGK